MKIICKTCGKNKYICPAKYKLGGGKKGNFYCSMKCSGIGRRLNKSLKQRRLEKKLYDEEYRLKNLKKIKEIKRQAHIKNYNPKEAAKIRKLNMARHVKYCQQPEYKKWKAGYDKIYRAKREYGEYAEAFLALMGIESEVEKRISKYEIGLTNGTINKKQNRRRDYEKTISNHA